MTERCKLIVQKALAIVRPLFRLHFEGGIHGLPHWSRVWFHDKALAASLDVDPAVLAWFAFLHDSHTTGDATVLACWDADQLDLGRVGIRHHPERLCAPHARQGRSIEAAGGMSEGLPRQRVGGSIA